MLRPVSDVTDMKTQLGPAGRYVDPVYQHSQRHHVGFIREQVKAGCVGFIETAVEHVGLFFRCQEDWGSKVYHRCSCKQPTFFEPSIRTVAHRGWDSATSNFQERLRRLRTGLWVRPISRTRFAKCAFLYGCGPPIRGEK